MPLYSPEQLRTLSDRELLGVLVSRKTSEVNLSDTLLEARRRNIPGLANAVTYLFRRRSDSLRLGAINTLLDIGSTENTPEVLPLLNDQSPVIRLRAAEFLSHYGDRRALEVLNYRLESEEVLLVVTRYSERSEESIRKVPVKARL